MSGAKKGAGPPPGTSKIAKPVVRGLTGMFTARELRFAQLYAGGMPSSKAYVEAGYSPKTAVNSARILERPKLLAEIEALVRQRQERADVKALDVVRELGRVAMSDMRDLAEWGPDGVKLRPSHELSDAAARAVAEIEEREYADGSKSMKIKLWDKNRALSDLSKVLGMLVHRVSFQGHMEVSAEKAPPMDPAEQAAQIMAVLGEIQGGLTGGGVIDVPGRAITTTIGSGEGNTTPSG